MAAEQCGRVCVGIEIDPRFVAVTLERLAGRGLTPRLIA
jgi:DNA modification methylase